MEPDIYRNEVMETIWNERQRMKFGFLASVGSVGSAILAWVGIISAVAGMIGAVCGAVIGIVAVYDLAQKRGWIKPSK